MGEEGEASFQNHFSKADYGSGTDDNSAVWRSSTWRAQLGRKSSCSSRCWSHAAC